MKVVVLFALIARAIAAPADCAQCHPAQSASFADTKMAHALETGAKSAILKANPKLTADVGGYHYEIAAGVYSVSDGKSTMHVPIAWAFGQGAAGQTYLFEREGRWYESRVSYYSALHGLDVTVGMRNITPHDLPEAAGRLIGVSEAGKCFDCHATGVVKSPHVDLSKMNAGLQCERCHGAAAAHVATQAPMRKLGSLTAEEMSDLCGECHRTWADIAANGPRGIQNVRFQPYRLGNSKCYDPGDARIRCTACHDPHGRLQTSATAYDAKCGACHAKSVSAHVCRVGTKDCVSCHMPKLELPGAHTKFTDHWIHVLRAGEPYPD